MGGIEEREMCVCLKTCWVYVCMCVCVHRCVCVCVCGMTLNCVIVRTDQMSRETYGACSQMAKENKVYKTKKEQWDEGNGEGEK